MKMIISTVVILFFFQQNQPPVVKITMPKSGDALSVGAPLRYSISVSDKEDGDTKYEEINTNEILLTVKLNGAKAGDRSVLHAMMTSNCMNCHAFTTKLIGPSFQEISEKKSNAAELSKHVKLGSTGVWGQIVMPSHPELDDDEIGKMVEWILKFKTQQNTQYYLGKEGAVKLANAGAVTLTASYLDHNKTLGEDVVAVQVK
ncbi:MAG: hypothetical protein EOP49_23410 [Sphingobacteriales bacterium]|nr:MAG: hypothetical protein EOP49_23410 [Sphingobacteriales bacterium]